MTEPRSGDETETAALTRLQLELAAGREPISGYVHDATGRHEFAGWIELTRVIGAAHQPTPAADADPGRSPNPRRTDDTNN